MTSSIQIAERGEISQDDGEHDTRLLRTEALERREALDAAIAELLARRMALCLRAALAKEALGLPRRNLAREQEVLTGFAATGESVGVDRKVATHLMSGVLQESNRLQGELLATKTEQLPDIADAEHIKDEVRQQIDEIDEIVAQLIGERQLVVMAASEAAVALGETAHDLQGQQREITTFVELATAGGMGSAFAANYITQLTHLRVNPRWGTAQ